MTVGQWLLAGFTLLLVVGVALVVRAWWQDKNGGGA